MLLNSSHGPDPWSWLHALRYGRPRLQEVSQSDRSRCKCVSTTVACKPPVWLTWRLAIYHQQRHKYLAEDPTGCLELAEVAGPTIYIHSEPC